MDPTTEFEIGDEVIVVPVEHVLEEYEVVSGNGRRKRIMPSSLSRYSDTVLAKMMINFREVENYLLTRNVLDIKRHGGRPAMVIAREKYGGDHHYHYRLRFEDGLEDGPYCPSMLTMDIKSTQELPEVKPDRLFSFLLS